MGSEVIVMVVDDNEANRAILVDYLNAMGLSVVEMENGSAAIDSARQSAPDLILLDVLMPELDGRAVLEILKADKATAGIPIIIITALDDDFNAVNCIERGAEDYIPKPFNPALLKARVKSCLEKKELLDQQRLYHKGEGFKDCVDKLDTIRNQLIEIDKTLNVGEILTQELKDKLSDILQQTEDLFRD